MISRRAILCAPFLALPARAQSNEVDCLLILAVDVSASMTPASQETQRRGYFDAITDPEVMRAIRGGALGRIALTFIEWAGEHEQRIVVPWTLIHDEASAGAFGASLQGVPPVKWGQTSISGALLFSASQFAQSPYEASRRVIDVSGDGTNNSGPPVPPVRDTLVQSRTIINGLPITDAEPTVADFYRDNVIGGHGSFLIPVTDMTQFREALRQKLILELA